jgi:hypothetical protein
MTGAIMQGANAVNALELGARATVEDGVVRVSYDMRNRSQQTMVAYDGATGTGGGDYPDLSAGCYVSYSDGECRILRIRPSPHPLRTTTRILIPPASVVDPGQTRRVQFRLPLPLKERAEYTPDYPGATYALRPVHRLILRIGYFWKTPETVLKPLPPAGVWQVLKGAPLVGTHQLSQSCLVTFDMQVRTDADFLRM